MKRVKQHWPQDKIILVCRKGLGSFFLKTSLVDEVIEVTKGNSESYSLALEKLSAHQINCLLSPHESLRTAIFCSKIKAQKKISFKKAWNFLFFSERIIKNKKLPDAIRQLSLLSTSDTDLHKKVLSYSENNNAYLKADNGLLSAPPDWASMSLRADFLKLKDEVDILKNKFALKDLHKVILLFPGSVWATKKWTQTGYISVGQALAAQGFEVVVMGGPGEENLCEEVANKIPNALSLAGKTSIYESVLLIANSALVVGNDSASAHMAAMCETPSVAVFGPTIIEFGYRPWSAKSYLVESKELACRPCGKHGHKQCPIKTHECMKHISAKEVLEKIDYALSNK